MDQVVIAKAIIINDGKILLIRRSETAPLRPLQWDISGGHVEPGEFIEEAAAREAKEETGIILEARDMRLVYSLAETPREDLSGNWLFFVCKTDQTEVSLSNEHVEYAWVDLQTALEYITYDRQNKALRYIAENNLI